MTVVMAFNLQNSIQIMADTRVTCPDLVGPNGEKFDPERGVRKIIPVMPTGRERVNFIGVSGDLDNAKIILHKLFEGYRVSGYEFSVQNSHKLMSYSLDELSTKIDFSGRKAVSLILCGFDKLDGHDEIVPIIVEYTVSGNNQVKTSQQHIVSIIGSGEKHRKTLFNIFGKNLRYQRQFPRQSLFMNGHLASDIYEDDEDYKDNGVGGPFQLITIQQNSPNEYIEDIIWAEEGGFGLGKTHRYDGFTIIEHPNRPDDCKLYNLWNWKC